MVKLLMLLLAAAAPAGAELTQIGSAAAVSGSVQAAAPGAVGRVIESGKPLYLNDHVTTDGKGRLQVLLADETVFTLGPNSDMVLDEFVYDPSSGAGKVSAKIAKGVFRFVTGKVARKDPEKMKVKLSVGTIGIRGTTVAGMADPVAGRDTVVLVDNGMAVVNNGGGSVWLRAPGFGTTMTGAGAPPAPPQPMGPALAQIMSQLNNPPAPPQSQQQPPQQTQQQPSQQQPSQPNGPPPPPGAPAAGSLSSAEEQSGLTTAGLFSAAQVTQQLAGLAAVSNAEVTQAVQDTAQSAAVPTTSWDEMRGLASLGQVQYIAEGTYTGISGGVPTSGYMGMGLLVDFANRNFGSDHQSMISLEGPMISDSTLISGNFGDSGKAAITLDVESSTNNCFNGTTIMFNNTAAGIAKEVAVDLQYNAGADLVASGSMTGTYAPPPQ